MLEGTFDILKIFIAFPPHRRRRRRCLNEGKYSEIKKFLLTNFLFIFNSTQLMLCVSTDPICKKKMMKLIYLE